MRVFLIPILKWFTGLKWADFVRVVSTVQAASEYFPKAQTFTEAEKEQANTSRAEMVRGFIKRNWPKVSGWALNLVLELAVGWFNRSAK